MKNLLQLLFWWLCLWHLNTLQAQSQVLDNFDKEPPNVGKKYSNFVGTQRRYDIYSKKAGITLSFVKSSSCDSSHRALRMAFDLPPALFGAIG